MKRIVLRIGGMSCSACSGGLEKYLNRQDGISMANVNLVMASASVEYDENKINYDDIARYVKESGFECIGEYSKTEDKDTSSSKKQFIIYTSLAILLLYAAMGHMMGLPVPPVLNMHTHPLWLYSISFLLAFPFLIYGYDIIKSGIKNIIHLTPNMDSLVTIGVFSALIYSITVSLLFALGKTDTPPEVYFESVAIVIYFVKLGRFIDRKSKSRTKNAISSLVQLTPTYAYVKTDTGSVKIPLDEVKEGDTVICHPGEKIAVDGEITKGCAHVDEAFITGESKPALKKEGDTVLAGSLNVNGYVEYTAKRVGKSSTVSEIVHLVLESSATKAPIAKTADIICLYFVPTVVAIAIISFIIHLALGLGISSAVGALITVLVVACPCALGLATPLATVISEGELARDGILIKKSEILESASKLNTVIFDKTGTLTHGKMKIADKYFFGCNERDIMSVICGAEARSSHPISRAFSEYATENKILPADVSDFQVIDGCGISVSHNGSTLYLVNGKYLNKLEIENPHRETELTLSKKGNSIVYAVQNSKILALFGISDTVREGTANELLTLEKNGIECVMLTGDNQETASVIASELNISKVIAGVMPKGKAEVVKQIKAEGKMCAMVGDGINDAVALSASDISISMHGATDIAMDCADVILTHSSIGGISKLITTSKRTLKIIKENLFFAFLYNSLMIPIAAGALLGFGISINPMIASLAMVMSSLCVSLNSLRLIKRRK
ncbi:MAG: copper-translocating P-type ATPase [Clostridia bacterium]|nr:copper-translocating P-type ATPase [Clostridia bacterium]